eukprot:4856076-Amphidinium_carterae.1
MQKKQVLASAPSSCQQASKRERKNDSFFILWTHSPLRPEGSTHERASIMLPARTSALSLMWSMCVAARCGQEWRQKSQNRNSHRQPDPDSPLTLTRRPFIPPAHYELIHEQFPSFSQLSMQEPSCSLTLEVGKTVGFGRFCGLEADKHAEAAKFGSFIGLPEVQERCKQKQKQKNINVCKYVLPMLVDLKKTFAP